ncbi:MAG: hypothetical protein HN790_03590 [Methylococcales bacterium]|jgi:peptidyl-prolyl cis-trans isomerase D|nr:hypothetical protein [Methylococcales bacterium]
MLQDIRERAQGWIAWVIVFIISIPFALWGIQSYLGGGGNTDVATLDGEGINGAEYRNAKTRLREELPEQFPDTFIQQLALERVINQRLMNVEIQKQNYQINSQDIREAIAQTPNFIKDGKFNYELYNSVLSSAGLNAGQYESQIRRQAILAQFKGGYVDTAFVTDDELKAYIKISQQKRDFSFVLISSEQFEAGIMPSESAVSTYYDKNKSRYMQAERVQAEYVAVRRSEIMKTIDPSEDQLQKLFETEAESLGRIESRNTSHIFVAIEDADNVDSKAAALVKITALSGRINSGESFADVAKSGSEDVSASNGGFIGFLTRDDDTQDPKFLEAAFALDVNQVSEVVESGFGYHLIQVSEIKDNELTFESARDELLKMHREQEVGVVYDAAIKSLEDFTYSDGAEEAERGMAEAAESLGVKVVNSGWVTQSGGAGVVASSKVVLDQIFDPEFIQGGNNSTILEVSPDLAIVIRVTEHEEAAPSPLSEVEAQIKQKLVADEAANKALELGVKYKSELTDGLSLTDLVAKYNLTLETKKDIDRKSLDVPSDVRNEAFKVMMNKEGSAKPVGTAVSEGYVIISLEQVTDADVEEEVLDFHRESLTEAFANREFADVMKNIRDNTEVETFPNNF